MILIVANWSKNFKMVKNLKNLKTQTSKKLLKIDLSAQIQVILFTVN